MANGTVHKTLLFFIVSMALLALPTAHLLMGQAGLSTEGPLQLLTRYLQATYARDYRDAYRFISLQDRRLKDERTYARERGAFSGFTLQMAKKLAGFIEAVPIENKITGSHAIIKLRLKLPDANKLSAQLLDWDEDRLNSLSAREQRSLMETIDKLKNEERLSIISAEDDFELVKEGNSWRVFLNWAAGVRIILDASVPPSASLIAEPVRKETLIRPGELFTIGFRVYNPSPREISTRIAHRVEPKAMSEYLDIVECGLLFPVKVSPGEKGEYSTTYFLRGDLPDGIKRLSVTYEFQIDER